MIKKTKGRADCHQATPLTTHKTILLESTAAQQRQIGGLHHD